MCSNIYKHNLSDKNPLTVLSKGEVIKYNIFVSVVVIELSKYNTGPEDRLFGPV